MPESILTDRTHVVEKRGLVEDADRRAEPRCPGFPALLSSPRTCAAPPPTSLGLRTPLALTPCTARMLGQTLHLDLWKRRSIAGNAGMASEMCLHAWPLRYSALSLRPRSQGLHAAPVP